MLQLRGAAALSSFRVNKLLASARQKVARLAAISTEFVHFVDLECALDDDGRRVLEQLLCYGTLSDSPVSEATENEGPVLLVVPRLGSISPWSSKATDIAHNCGLGEVHRIERGVVYNFQTSDGAPLTDSELTSLRPLVHDRMTERVLESFSRGSVCAGRTCAAAFGRCAQ